MITLEELQEQFINGINSENDAILNYINQSENLSAKEHLAIYRSSMFGALQKNLKDIYSVCNKLVGDDFFIHMINAYIEDHPSQSPNIASYGEDFGDFIALFPPAKSLPYLPDIARLEWAWHKAYSARYTLGIDFQKLAACYETLAEKIIFSLPHNSTLLSSAYPIHRIWEVNQDGYEGNQTVVLENNVNYYYLVWQNKFEMRIDILNEAEWNILKCIEAITNLGELYQKINETLPGTNFEMLLPAMVAKGWFAEFSVE